MQSKILMGLQPKQKGQTLWRKSVIANESLAIGTYRFAVSTVIPSMTKAAWSMKKDELKKSRPGITRKKFIYNLSHREFHSTFKERHHEPGIGARVLAFIIQIVPKIGPLKALPF